MGRYLLGINGKRRRIISAGETEQYEDAELLALAIHNNNPKNWVYIIDQQEGTTEIERVAMVADRHNAHKSMSPGRVNLFIAVPAEGAKLERVEWTEKSLRGTIIKEIPPVRSEKAKGSDTTWVDVPKTYAGSKMSGAPRVSPFAREVPMNPRGKIHVGGDGTVPSATAPVIMYRRTAKDRRALKRGYGNHRQEQDRNVSFRDMQQQAGWKGKED